MHASLTHSIIIYFCCQVKNDFITLFKQVVDKDPSKSVGEFTDISKVEKYEMPADEYDKRKGKNMYKADTFAPLPPRLGLI